ncbi:MAG: hypothetical protein AAGA66_11495 [Bacteroidota bacterium]
MTSRFILATTICLFFIHCSGQNIYKAFYKGEGNTMYFIYPLEYKNEKGEKLLIDFTLETKSDTVRLVFTLNSLLNTRINTLSLLDKNDQEIQLTNLQKILVDKKKKWFHIRYEGDMALTEFESICAEPNTSVVLNSNASFVPTKKTTKSLDEFNDSVLVTFDH